MGLLEKRNHTATRQSVIIWAAGGGLVGGIVGLLHWVRSDMPAWAVFFIVPWMIIFCAIAGGAMEWQMPSVWKSDAEPGAPPDRGGN